MGALAAVIAVLVTACGGAVADPVADLTLPEAFCQARSLCPSVPGGHYAGMGWAMAASVELGVPAGATFDECVERVAVVDDYLGAERAQLAVESLQTDPCGAPGVVQ